MGLSALFNRLLDKPTTNHHLEIRKDSFFLDEKKHQQFLTHGWCVIENVVKPEEIQSFKKTFDEISKLEGFKLADLFFNSGRLHNPEIRKKTQDVINLNAQTILPRMFKMEKVDPHTGGAFQVKPPHANSALSLHQDSTVIDEENDYCLFTWIPFCDITLQNGPVSFIPGSHLWGNTQRSLGVPWQFLQHIPTMLKYAVPVTVKAGDVIVFDTAVIHASSPNLSNELRPAVTISVLHKNYQLVYYFRNKEIDDSLIEKYLVDENFYYNYDFVSKPDETKWKKTVLKFEPFDLSEKEMIRLIEKHLPEKP